MRLSARSKYAISAMLELALQYRRKYVSVAELSEKQGVSRPLLEKLLLQLKRAGLTESRRGPDGGYSLACPPDEIRIGDIFRVVEGPVNCTDGLDASSQPGVVSHCIGFLLQEIEDGICTVLNARTLQDLCCKARELKQLSQPAHSHSFSI
jgi:Rrf2 family transcriptional regulator, cysteine metabolism repressor